MLAALTRLVPLAGQCIGGGARKAPFFALLRVAGRKGGHDVPGDHSW